MTFEFPMINVQKLAVEDVILTSGGIGGDGEYGGSGAED